MKLVSLGCTKIYKYHSKSNEYLQIYNFSIFSAFLLHRDILLANNNWFGYLAHLWVNVKLNLFFLHINWKILYYISTSKIYIFHIKNIYIAYMQVDCRATDFYQSIGKYVMDNQYLISRKTNDKNLCHSECAKNIKIIIEKKTFLCALLLVLSDSRAEDISLAQNSHQIQI